MDYENEFNEEINEDCDYTTEFQDDDDDNYINSNERKFDFIDHEIDHTYYYENYRHYNECDIYEELNDYNIKMNKKENCEKELICNKDKAEKINNNSQEKASKIDIKLNINKI